MFHVVLVCEMRLFYFMFISCVFSEDCCFSNQPATTKQPGAIWGFHSIFPISVPASERREEHANISVKKVTRRNPFNGGSL